MLRGSVVDSEREEGDRTAAAGDADTGGEGGKNDEGKEGTTRRDRLPARPCIVARVAAPPGPADRFSPIRGAPQPTNRSRKTSGACGAPCLRRCPRTRNASGRGTP